MIDPGSSLLPAVIQQATEAMPAESRGRFIKFALRMIFGPSLTKWLDAYEQSKLDDEGRAILNRKLAEKAGDLAAADPAKVERYLVRMVGDAAVRQSNLEAIVGQAAEELPELTRDSPLEKEAAPDMADDPPTEVSEDWRRRFTDYAQEISDPELRSIWARVLAGEFRKPGSFSYRTLRLLSEIEPSVAREFNEISSNVFSSVSIFTPPSDWSTGINFRKMSTLLDWGLVNENVGFVAHILNSRDGQYLFVGGRTGLFITLQDKPPQIRIPIVNLTVVGRELLTLVGARDEEAVVRRIAETLRPMPKKAGDQCFLCDLTPMPGEQFAFAKREELWSDSAS